MKHALLLITVSILAVACSANQTYQSNSTPQFIEQLGSTVSSEEQAQTMFTEWLTDNTDFSSPNKIESIHPKKNYYDITLSTSITINERTNRVLGYKYYKLDSTGALYGYYMSK